MTTYMFFRIYLLAPSLLQLKRNKIILSNVHSSILITFCHRYTLKKKRYSVYLDKLNVLIIQILSQRDIQTV